MTVLTPEFVLDLNS